jgi:hypothetical protein
VANGILQPPELRGVGSRTHVLPGTTRTFTGTSAATAAIDAAEVLLYATQACWVYPAQESTAAVVGTSIPVPAGIPFYIQITPGDIINVVRDGADGTLTIIATAP